MSLQSTEEITCPKCASNFPFIRWDSVNVSLDPEQKAKILDNSFFRTTCPNCSVNIFIPYSLLYHDMEQKLMIFFDDDETSDSENEKLKLPPNMFFNDIQGEYKFRNVHGVNRLVEKILIFDNNLDDVEIERIKFGLTFWLVQQKSLTQYPKIYFNNRDEDSFEFYIEEENKDGYTAKIEMFLYNELNNIVQLQNANFTEGQDVMNINFDWIAKHYKNQIGND